MPMVHVLAIITAKPGQRDAFLEAFRANTPAVHAEEGCIEYGATIDTEDVGRLQTPVGEDTVVIVEKWASLDALKAHGASPHMAAFGETVRDMVANRVVHVLSPA